MENANIPDLYTSTGWAQEGKCEAQVLKGQRLTLKKGRDRCLVLPTKHDYDWIRVDELKKQT